MTLATPADSVCFVAAKMTRIGTGGPQAGGGGGGYAVTSQSNPGNLDTQATLLHVFSAFKGHLNVYCIFKVLVSNLRWPYKYLTRSNGLEN